MIEVVNGVVDFRLAVTSTISHASQPCAVISARLMGRNGAAVTGCAGRRGIKVWAAVSIADTQ